MQQWATSRVCVCLFFFFPLQLLACCLGDLVIILDSRSAALRTVTNWMELEREGRDGRKLEKKRGDLLLFLCVYPCVYVGRGVDKMKQWPRHGDNWKKKNKQQKSWQSFWLENYWEIKHKKTRAILAYLICIRGIFISPDVEASNVRNWTDGGKKGESSPLFPIHLAVVMGGTWVLHAELMICCQLRTADLYANINNRFYYFFFFPF